MLKKTLTIIILFSAIAVFAQNNAENNNRFMLGQSYQQSGDLERAKTIFSDLYNSNPYNPQFFQALNEVLVQLKDYESSINLINQKIKITPQDINLYGMLGSTYYFMGDEEKAFKTWDGALAQFSSNPVTYRVIANYAIERRAFDKAIEIMKRGKAVSEDPNMFAYDLANLYAVTMRYKEAAMEYCDILKNNSNQLNAIQGRLYPYMSKPDALKDFIEVFEDCANDDISFNYMLAKLYIEQKNYDRAYEYYKDIDNSQGRNGSELFNFAQQIYGENEYKVASEVYSDIIKKYPESPFISNATLGFAKTTEAIVLTENSAISNNWKPFYKSDYSFAAKVEPVISAYEDIINKYPHSEIANEAYVRIGKLKLTIQGKPEEAKEYFARLINDAPVSLFAADAYEELADIELQKGNLDESINYLNKLKTAPRAEQEDRYSADYKLANIYFYKGDFEKSKELLTQLLNNLKDNSANDAIQLSLLLNTTMNDSSNLVIFAEGELLAEQEKFKEAQDKYRQVAESQKGFMLNHLAKIRTAEMELAQGNLETSADLFSKIAEENEKNIYADKALYLLGKIYQFGKNDAAKAIEIYESLLAKFPGSLYLDEAREEIIKLRQKLS